MKGLTLVFLVDSPIWWNGRLVMVTVPLSILPPALDHIASNQMVQVFMLKRTLIATGLTTAAAG